MNGLATGCPQNQYLMQFEEVKRKLKGLDHPDSSSGSDLHSQPIKRSRPLVLPTAHSSAAASGKTASARSLSSNDRGGARHKLLGQGKMGKSQHSSPKAKEEGDEPRASSPLSRPPTSAASSAASSPLPSGDAHPHDSRERWVHACFSLRFIWSKLLVMLEWNPFHPLLFLSARLAIAWKNLIICHLLI